MLKTRFFLSDDVWEICHVKLVAPMEGATATADVVYLAVFYRGPSALYQTKAHLREFKGGTTSIFRVEIRTWYSSIQTSWVFWTVFFQEPRYIFRLPRLFTYLFNTALCYFKNDMFVFLHSGDTTASQIFWWLMQSYKKCVEVSCELLENNPGKPKMVKNVLEVTLTQKKNLWLAFMLIQL